MLISFGKKPQIKPLELDIEHVHIYKCLGLIISDDLTRKAGCRLLYLHCLKRAGLNIDELLKVYDVHCGLHH